MVAGSMVGGRAALIKYVLPYVETLVVGKRRSEVMQWILAWKHYNCTIDVCDNSTLC